MKNAMQLKAIMKKLAKENQISAQLVLQNYMLERFLERVSLSPYRDNYIIKGGFLISSMVGLNSRATMDMDATIKGYPVTQDVFLTINEKTHESESCDDLHTASQLCHRLLDDMAITVLLQTKRNHNFTNMDKDEAARVRAAWKPVIEKLPDYAYLCDEILREAQENEEENGIDLQ
jgi:hypothetical protein